MRNPFRYFNSSLEVIRLTVMMYVRYLLSLRQVEDLLYERGIDISHETVWYWWNRFGPMFAAEIRKRRVHHRSYSNWRWHLGEVFVRINGETHYLWRAVDREGEVLEVFATKRRDRKAALTFLKREMRRHGRPRSIVTDRLRSYRAAMNVIGNAADQTCGRWLNNRAESSHQPFRRREGAMAKFRDITSGTVFHGTPMLSHYVASKAGVIGLTRSAASELGEHGITVNAIAPSLTLTEGIQADPRLLEYADRRIATRAVARHAVPEDLVPALLFLASPEAGFVTGQTLSVSGGEIKL
jgi:putative transposase